MENMIDFDGAWKKTIDGFFRQLMEFLLPAVAEKIDWQRGYEFLEEELLKIQKTAHIGKKVADKLIKVFRKNGDETFVICHLEIHVHKRREPKI